MTADLLARPVWSTLTTRHARFAVGNARARRFAPEIGPLAAARDDTPESVAALGALVPEGEPLVLLQADPIVVPPGCVAATAAAGVQMIAERQMTVARDARVQRLTEADAVAMLELATLTRPGPFAIGTPSLGDFWGIRECGALVAMAGERMKHPGFTEISGVCTHPDARGRGLARTLSALVTARIFERGETPYLHAYAANAAAIALYESLGFRLRRSFNVATIARVDSIPFATAS